jgi:hypothetical protein
VVGAAHQAPRRKLTDCCADWGILDLLADSEMGAVGTPDSRVAPGEEDNQLTYGIRNLEIEE